MSATFGATLPAPRAEMFVGTRHHLWILIAFGAGVSSGVRSPSVQSIMKRPRVRVRGSADERMLVCLVGGCDGPEGSCNDLGVPSGLILRLGDVMGVESVSLADLIYQLRGDLYRAAWQGEDRDPKFVVGPVELELAVVVDSSRGGGASAALWVVDVSAEGKRSSQTTHRIRLTLQPVGSDGAPSKVSGEAMVGEEDPD